jgi:hypothetical protein
MLKYGSCTTSGVAGARKAAAESCCPLDGIERQDTKTTTKRTRVKKLAISVLPDFLEH